MINRDKDGYASGKLFLDDGETLSQLKDQTYEYYELIASGNADDGYSIKKQILNEKIKQ